MSLSVMVTVAAAGEPSVPVPLIPKNATPKLTDPPVVIPRSMMGTVKVLAVASPSCQERLLLV